MLWKNTSAGKPAGVFLLQRRAMIPSPHGIGAAIDGPDLDGRAHARARTSCCPACQWAVPPPGAGYIHIINTGNNGNSFPQHLTRTYAVPIPTLCCPLSNN